MGIGKYLELKDKGSEATDDKFYRYAPEVLKIGSQPREWLRVSRCKRRFREMRSSQEKGSQVHQRKQR